MLHHSKTILRMPARDIRLPITAGGSFGGVVSALVR